MPSQNLANIEKPTLVPSSPISALDLSVRAFNCLSRAKINTIEDILALKTLDDFARIRNLGWKCADEILDKMRDHGFAEWADQIGAATHTHTHTHDCCGK